MTRIGPGPAAPATVIRELRGILSTLYGGGSIWAWLYTRPVDASVDRQSSQDNHRHHIRSDVTHTIHSFPSIWRRSVIGPSARAPGLGDWSLRCQGQPACLWYKPRRQFALWPNRQSGRPKGAAEICTMLVDACKQLHHSRTRLATPVRAAACHSTEQITPDVLPKTQGYTASGRCVNATP